MLRAKLLLPVLALGLGACRTTSDNSSSEAKAVFGNDDRETLTMANPFDAVAHLDTANGGTCTAFMISPRVGLTAGHCTEGVANNGFMKMQFRGDNGASVTIQLLSRGSSSYTGNINDDWAIFVLTDGVKSNQWLGFQAGAYNGAPLHLSGYSTDKVGATTTDHCTAHVVQNAIIYHDCDMQGGASGGPIFMGAGNGQWYAVGIQSGHHAFGQQNPVHATWSMANSNLGCALGTNLVQSISQYKALYP